MAWAMTSLSDTLDWPASSACLRYAWALVSSKEACKVNCTRTAERLNHATSDYLADALDRSDFRTLH